MKHRLSIFPALVMLMMLPILVSCIGITAPQPSSGSELLLGMSTETPGPCKACAEATLAAALYQEKNNSDSRAAATAAIMRANAEATLGSIDATLRAVQTQEQNNADTVAARAAATAGILRANAQATLNSAAATQNAALVQDAIRQTQAVEEATRSAQTLLIQMDREQKAAGTQTAVANNIATQTQAALATAQWYSDQARQRAEQRQEQFTFMLTLCIPVFLIAIAGLVFWGIWRMLTIQQENQRILEEPVEIVQVVRPIITQERTRPQPGESIQYLDDGSVDRRYHLTKPDKQIGDWLDDVKRTLENDDSKDENDDNPVN